MEKSKNNWLKRAQSGSEKSVYSGDKAICPVCDKEYSTDKLSWNRYRCAHCGASLSKDSLTFKAISKVIKSVKHPDEYDSIKSKIIEEINKFDCHFSDKLLKSLEWAYEDSMKAVYEDQTTKFIRLNSQHYKIIANFFKMAAEELKKKCGDI